MFPKKTFNLDYKLPAMAGGIASFDELKRISPFFTETNPVSYAVLLEANKNKMSDTEIEQTQNLIRHLTNKENETMKAVSQYLKTREEYQSSSSVDSSSLS